MARKKPTLTNAVTSTSRNEKTKPVKKSVAIETESKEQLLSRVKRELLRTFITAAIALAAGIALEKLVKF